MLSSQEVADYFLSHKDACRTPITPLKLQKLMYYAQGYHLAIIGSPLFEDPIEAWDHGPVVQAVYQKYRCYGNSKIPGHQLIDGSNFEESHLTVLNYVADAYGDKGAWTLRNMTHEETPWLNHSPDGKRGDNSVITHKEMFDFFSTKIPSRDYVDEFIASHEKLRIEDTVELPETVQSADDFRTWLNSL